MHQVRREIDHPMHCSTGLGIYFPTVVLFSEPDRFFLVTAHQKTRTDDARDHELKKTDQPTNTSSEPYHISVQLMQTLNHTTLLNLCFLQCRPKWRPLSKDTGICRNCRPEKRQLKCNILTPTYYVRIYNVIEILMIKNEYTQKTLNHY